MPALIFDTETHAKVDPLLVEAGGILLPGESMDLVSLSPIARYEERFNPGQPIDRGAMAVHHILDEDVKDCPPASSFSLENWFFDPASDYLIGHNVDFDWGVIGKPECRRIDTLALARAMLQNLSSHSLGAVAYELLEPSAARALLRGKAHGAGADCEVTRHVLLKLLPMVKANGYPLTWHGLWQCSEKARIPIVMPFGKYKGEAIENLPRDYLDWALRGGLTDIDDYLRRALSAAYM